jgi:SAM-dependent methyltransferase
MRLTPPGLRPPDSTEISIDGPARATSSAFNHLQAAVDRWLPLEALDPVEYAAGHALFESRSDQRANLIEWLVGHLAARAGRPSRVLSIGCGDGSVDVAVATALASHGHRVDYIGVEPHAPSARAFGAGMAAVAEADTSVLTQPFEQARPDGLFDVVLAVHSLYYVADLAETLRRARTFLAPDGEVIVLHAPLEPLNMLVRLLSPGRKQAFGDELASSMSIALGRAPRTVRIDNRLDLTSTGDLDMDRQLMAFTVQARLPATLLEPVRSALAERALPEAGLVLAHPVDAYVARRERCVPGHGRAAF